LECRELPLAVDRGSPLLLPLLVEQDEAVTTITINDAPWNRMSFEFMDELEALVDQMVD
jgi:enoyl-CoA hydratase/carnithine racemase